MFFFLEWGGLRNGAGLKKYQKWGNSGVGFRGEMGKGSARMGLFVRE